METRLKERLTGAAILVALIVLLVPEMFHGQRRDIAASAGSSGEGAPLRSYTIDLSNGSARTTPLQSTATASAANAATDASPSAAPAPPAPPIAAAPQVSAAPSEPAKPSAAAATAASPVITKSGNPAASARVSAGAWSVQLGLFAQRDNADRLMRSAQSKGFAVSLSDRDAKGFYHVHSGGVADRAAAQSLQQRLHDQGFAAAVVAPQPSGGKMPQQ